MIDRIEAIKTKALEDLGRVQDAKLLEEWRITYLGKRSELNLTLRGLGSIDPADRPVVGQIANDVKRALEDEFTARREQLERQAREAELSREYVDVTLPGRPLPRGQRHPITLPVDAPANALPPLPHDFVEAPYVACERHNFGLL